MVWYGEEGSLLLQYVLHSVQSVQQAALCQTKLLLNMFIMQLSHINQLISAAVRM